MDKDVRNKQQTMRKLKWVRPEEQQQYLQQGICTLKQAKTILKIRLQMIATRTNHKSNEEDTTGRRCGTEEETTEHVLNCYAGMNFEEEKLEDVEWLKQILPIYDEIHKLSTRSETKDVDDQDEE